MKRHNVVLLSAILLVTTSALTYGQVPIAFNYQGRLLSGTNLVNGSVSVVARIYTNNVGGVSIYEDSNSVTVVDGLYKIVVGDDMTLGSLTNALATGEAFLEISVNGQTLSPREQILSSSFAIKANGVKEAGIEAGMIADGAVGESKLADDAVSNAKLADASVTSNKIDWTDMPEGLEDGDQDTTYTAGEGLDLVGNEFSVTNGAITANKLADDAVTNTKLADSSVTSNKIDWTDMPAGLQDGDNDTTYTAGEGLDLIANEFSLTNGAVSNAKLADSSVTSNKIDWTDMPAGLQDGDDNTTYAAGEGLELVGNEFSITNGAITSAKLADAAVQEGKIENGAVSNDKLANNAVNNAKLADGSVTSNKIDWTDMPAGLQDGDQDTTYTAGEGLDLVANEFSLTNGAVTSAKLADSAVTSNKIDWTDMPAGLQDGDNDTTYTAGEGLDLIGDEFSLSNGAVTTAKLADGAVTTDKLDAGVDARYVNVTGDTIDSNLVVLGSVGIGGTTNPASALSVGLDTFQVDTDGNLVRVRDVPYSWPASQGAINTVLRNDGSGSLSWATVSAGGGSTSAVPEVVALYTAGADTKWNNQPTVITEFMGANRTRTKVDLTGASQVRITVLVRLVGSATAKIGAQFSTNQINWAYLDGVTSPRVTVNTTGLQVSAYASLTATAKQDVFLRLVGEDGNAAADPAFGLITLQFK